MTKVKITNHIQIIFLPPWFSINQSQIISTKQNQTFHLDSGQGRVRVSAGWRGRRAGFVGGEWCCCLSSVEAARLTQELPNERHMATGKVCSANTTHTVMIHSKLLFQSEHHKIYQPIHCELVMCRSLEIGTTLCFSNKSTFTQEPELD